VRGELRWATSLSRSCESRSATRSSLYFGLLPIVMTIKGTVFVLVTASLLYLTVRASRKAQQRIEAYLTEA